MRRLTIPLGVSAAALLWGCADVSQKPYQQPTVPEKASWSQAAGRPASPADTIQIDWWRQFQDPYLNNLVERAVNGNFDLKVLGKSVV